MTVYSVTPTHAGIRQRQAAVGRRLAPRACRTALSRLGNGPRLEGRGDEITATAVMPVQVDRGDINSGDTR
jgi:hypothetical protein